MEGSRTLRAGRFAYPEVPPVELPRVKVRACDFCGSVHGPIDRCDCCGARYCRRCAGPVDPLGFDCPEPGCNLAPNRGAL
jgi:hypothetical protein